MTILTDGIQNYFVPDPGDVRTRIAQGWRYVVDEVPSQDCTLSQPEAPQQVVSGTDGKVNVNTATLQELTALPHIGIATANKVIKARPIADYEDLIAKVPLKDPSLWIALEGKLTYATDSGSAESTI